MGPDTGTENSRPRDGAPERTARRFRILVIRQPSFLAQTPPVTQSRRNFLKTAAAAAADPGDPAVRALILPLAAGRPLMEEFFTYQFIIWVWPILGAVGLGMAAYFTRRFVRAQEKGVEHQLELTDLRRRIELIEEALEASQRDVLRLETAQEFTNRLLTERVQSSL